MALMERVGALIRANLNDLIDKAEDPEKMLKQLLIDLRNQLMQVKTQVAIAIADRHLLGARLQEHEDAESEWKRKAALAVEKGEDNLARAALEKSLASRSAAAGFRQQHEHQTVQVDNLKSALRKLQDKLEETQARAELLAAQNRRAKAMARAGDARLAFVDNLGGSTLERMGQKAAMSEAIAGASAELAADSAAEQIAALDRKDQVDRLLAELKARK